MDSDIIIFWIVCLSCFAGLARIMPRLRFIGRGWAVVFLSILLISVAGRIWGRSWLIYASAGLWLALILTPGIISRWYLRCFLQQRFQAACRLARVISWLHPADGWRQQPEIVHALELAQRNELAAAIEILKRFQDMETPIALAAIANLYRLTAQWEEFLAWQSSHSQQLKGQSLKLRDWSLRFSAISVA